ncbi:MAG TPA: CcmD family protein [Chitinophagaceae bacterium]|nr:CcmD family protein [Chitinophagaceae bacterium]
MTKFFSTLSLLLFLSLTNVGGQDKAEMADTMRTEGKIYVVVAIIVIVLAGLIFYLFTIEKKVKKLEKLVSDKKKQTN